MKDFTPDDTMKPVKPVCKDCGSDNVVFDVYGEWDQDNQMMTLRTHFEEAKCEGECGGEDTDVEWVELETTPPPTPKRRVDMTESQLRALVNPYPINEADKGELDYCKNVLRRYADSRRPQTYSRRFECAMESHSTNWLVFELMRAAVLDVRTRGGTRLSRGLKAFSRLDPDAPEWPDAWQNTFEGGRNA